MARRRIGRRRWGRASALAGSMAVAGWLAGCTAPQPARGTAALQAPVAAAAGQAGAVRPPEPSAWGLALAAKGCTPVEAPLGERLERLQRELQPLGLEPRLQGCVPLPAPAHAPALLLDARVTDGRKALSVVRGPLADGEPLDLGLPAAALARAGGSGGGAMLDRPDADVSPDVQFNRRWWRDMLGTVGLQAVPGQVRAFVPVP